MVNGLVASRSSEWFGNTREADEVEISSFRRGMAWRLRPFRSRRPQHPLVRSSAPRAYTKPEMKMHIACSVVVAFETRIGNKFIAMLFTRISKRWRCVSSKSGSARLSSCLDVDGENCNVNVELFFPQTPGMMFSSLVYFPNHSHFHLLRIGRPAEWFLKNSVPKADRKMRQALPDCQKLAPTRTSNT
ncbi:unnamed protein product [Urochloa humidicola]